MLIRASPHCLHAVTDNVVHVGDVSTSSSHFARNLGIMFKQTPSIKQHISHICRTSFIQLQNIRLKPHLSADSLNTLAYAFLASRIDYGSSLLIGIPDRCIQQLQHIQNCTAHLVINTQKYYHIQPVLKRVHWLTARQRFIFKILLITKQCMS